MAKIYRTRSYASMDEVQKTHMMQVHAMVGAGLVCAAWGAKMHMDATLPQYTGTWKTATPSRGTLATELLQGGHHMTLVQIICIIILGASEMT